MKPGISSLRGNSGQGDTGLCHTHLCTHQPASRGLSPFTPETLKLKQTNKQLGEESKGFQQNSWPAPPKFWKARKAWLGETRLTGRRANAGGRQSHLHGHGVTGTAAPRGPPPRPAGAHGGTRGRHRDWDGGVGCPPRRASPRSPRCSFSASTEAT